MKLVMYIDDKKVETLNLLDINRELLECMNELRDKYAALLKQGKTHSFMLEGVPSSMNGFKPLHH